MKEEREKTIPPVKSEEEKKGKKFEDRLQGRSKNRNPFRRRSKI
jgi:hypothetical protein